VIHDLGTFPYPFADNEFEEIICRHVIEHVPDVLGFVNELHHITKPGGKLKIVTPHYSNPDWATDPTHRNNFNSYSFTCFIPSRTPFPFYTTAELKPLATHVSLANLWRALGLELMDNLDQRWPSMRFTRKYWEFYLSTIFRAKALHFEFEVVKSRVSTESGSGPKNLRRSTSLDEALGLKFQLSYSEPPSFSETLVASEPNIRTITFKLNAVKKGIVFAALTLLAYTLRFGGILEPPRSK